MTGQWLFEHGLLQVGRFQQDHTIVPVRLELALLGAYPNILTEAAKALLTKVKVIAPVVDYLVCADDCIPITSAVCMEAKIPMVWSRGCGEAPAYDLIGPYDIGHPSCLIVNTITRQTRQLIADCHSVGLEITHLVSLVDAGDRLADVNTIKSHWVYDLASMIDELEKAARVPAAQARAIHKWITEAKTALE